MSKSITGLSSPLQRLSHPRSCACRIGTSTSSGDRRTIFISPQLRADTPRPSVLTASRTLPFPAYSIFKIIADINSYPQFLPYVRAAKVTAESARPDTYHKERWPALASLTVGFQENMSETYTSRVFCVPPVPHKGRAGVGFVEALSGSDAPKQTFTAEEDVSHYDIVSSELPENSSAGPLAFLRTRWTVSEYPHKPAPNNADETHSSNLEPHLKAKEQTDVNLAVEYRFQSPVYEALSQAASGKVADMMIEAFEKRVRKVL